MYNCSSCGAPLPANKIVCLYCGTRNMVDVAKNTFSHASKTETVRCCPGCNTEMETIDLSQGEKGKEGFFIEKCPACQGLFFDNEELQFLLEKKTAKVSTVNNERLNEISDIRISGKITYRPCPVCQKLMNRVNFGARSGTIVDQCRDHGVYLDGGELRQLLEWRKAGGHLVEQRSVESQEKERKRAEVRQEALRSNDAFSVTDKETSFLDMLCTFFAR